MFKIPALNLSISKSPLFDSKLPPLQYKPSAQEAPNYPGLWRIHWSNGDRIWLSTFYTRIDQACLLWGAIALLIFTTAQFAAIDWRMQAVIWSGVSAIGIGGMLVLTRDWLRVPPFRHIILAWAYLMGLGVVVTDAAIALSWMPILMQLCPLWLGLSAIASLYTGIQLRSRAFYLSTLIHLVAIGVLPSGWEFLTTGLVLGITSIVLAVLQWDSGGPCASHRVEED